jgi:hypothetical protein
MFCKSSRLAFWPLWWSLRDNKKAAARSDSLPVILFL